MEGHPLFLPKSAPVEPSGMVDSMSGHGWHRICNRLILLNKDLESVLGENAPEFRF
jgi:hypothetical protein